MNNLKMLSLRRLKEFKQSIRQFLICTSRWFKGNWICLRTTLFLRKILVPLLLNHQSIKNHPLQMKTFQFHQRSKKRKLIRISHQNAICLIYSDRNQTKNNSSKMENVSAATGVQMTQWVPNSICTINLKKRNNIILIEMHLILSTILILR